jgi:PAS domain S-box-containing protein
MQREKREKAPAAKVAKAVKGPKSAPRARVASPQPADLMPAWQVTPVAAAVTDLSGRVVTVNRRFARAVGLAPAACIGLALAELVPPDREVPFRIPPADEEASYRGHLDQVLARVDLASTGKLVSVIVTPIQEDADDIARRTLLALSREVAVARTEEEVMAALTRALDGLFPGRHYCVRLVDPKTLALTSLYAKGKMKPAARQRLTLKRSAVQTTGLSAEALEAAGVVLVERDGCAFDGCVQALAVPLAVGGVLFGIVNLEYTPGAPGSPGADESTLFQLANQAALGVRNLRSIEELTFLKTYLEELIENANALIVVANRDREILVFNRAVSRLTGYAREDVLGQDLLKFVPELEKKRMTRVIAKSLKGEQVTNFETRIAMKAGGDARVAVNTASIFGPSGEVEGIIAIGQDLTLLRALEQKAEHAQKLAGFGRLAAGIVHELNNPLTAITVYAESLESKLALQASDPADLEKVRRILESGQRILRFARDLITYARPSADKTEALDLAQLLDKAAQMCEPALKDANASLARAYGAVPAVEGVKGSLLQVFVNLITNAAHALEKGGTVTLTLEPTTGGVAAKVSDDGVGMNEEVRRRIFEPFFTTKPDGRGTGLGLSIVQGIIARHGGAISVDSLPGKGTTFTVTFPLSRPEEM